MEAEKSSLLQWYRQERRCLFLLLVVIKRKRVHELFMRVKYTTPSYQLGMGEQKKKKKEEGVKDIFLKKNSAK